jgi:hypothetical protein
MEGSMLDGALGRLLADLEKIDPNQRSAYETALYNELRALQSPGGLLPTLQAFARQIGIGDAAFRKVMAGSGIASLITDLAPGGGNSGPAPVDSDVTRLRCNRPDCPNKRR